MRVVVLGATGSIGVHTTLMLKEYGFDVYAAGHRESDNGFFQEYGITYFSFDIEKPDSLARIPDKTDAIVHLAGAMPARMKGYNPYLYINTIITGTMNVLEMMRIKGINKIIFAQSISDVLYQFGSLRPIMDDCERRFPINSDHSVYSISKNAAVNLIEHYSVKYNFDYFILRLPTIYVYHPSPFYYVNGEKRRMGYRILIDRAMKGQTLEVWGNPKSMKEMVYVKDFAQMVCLCVGERGKSGIYNVGSGFPISIEDQITKLAEIFCKGKRSSIVYRPEMPSSPQFILSIQKAINELGYCPQYNFVRMMNDFKAEMEQEPFARLWGIKDDYLCQI